MSGHVVGCHKSRDHNQQEVYHTFRAVLSSGVQVLLSQWCVIVREEVGTVHILERDISPHPAEREHTPFG